MMRWQLLQIILSITPTWTTFSNINKSLRNSFSSLVWWCKTTTREILKQCQTETRRFRKEDPRPNSTTTATSTCLSSHLLQKTQQLIRSQVQDSLVEEIIRGNLRNNIPSTMRTRLAGLRTFCKIWHELIKFNSNPLRLRMNRASNTVVRPHHLEEPIKTKQWLRVVPQYSLCSQLRAIYRWSLTITCNRKTRECFTVWPHGVVRAHGPTLTFLDTLCGLSRLLSHKVDPQMCSECRVIEVIRDNPLPHKMRHFPSLDSRSALAESWSHLTTNWWVPLSRPTVSTVGNWKRRTICAPGSN